MGDDEDDDDIRELRKLEQQYAEATTEERERLLPDLIRAIEKVRPGLSEKGDARIFNGDYLRDMFDKCMQRALDRPDLTPDRKTNAKEDAATFIACFDAAKQWPFPKFATHAFEMATLALFTGLRAGLSLSEIEGLQARYEFGMQRNRGHNSKKKKPWFWYARTSALKVPEKDRLLSNEKIAGGLWDDWAKEKPAKWAGERPLRPSFSSLIRFVGELRADKTYPQRPTPARRPRRQN